MGVAIVVVVIPIATREARDENIKRFFLHYYGLYGPQATSYALQL